MRELFSSKRPSVPMVADVTPQILQLRHLIISTAAALTDLDLPGINRAIIDLQNRIDFWLVSNVALNPSQDDISNTEMLESLTVILNEWENKYLSPLRGSPIWVEKLGIDKEYLTVQEVRSLDSFLSVLVMGLVNDLPIDRDSTVELLNNMFKPEIVELWIQDSDQGLPSTLPSYDLDPKIRQSLGEIVISATQVRH